MILVDLYWRPGDYTGPADVQYEEGSTSFGVPMWMTQGPGPTVFARWAVEFGDDLIMADLQVEPGTIVGAARGLDWIDGIEEVDWSDALRSYGRELEPTLDELGILPVLA
jgi:hypothetical protein